MTARQPNNPLHGVTLERILSELVARLGWAELGRRIDIRCVNHEPSLASSLKFLRRTPRAREQAEALYLDTLRAASAPAATDGKAPRNTPKALKLRAESNRWWPTASSTTLCASS